MDGIGTGLSTGVGSTLTTRREFAVRFDALYVAGGSPPLRHLASAAHTRARTVKKSGSAVYVSAQRISDWKAGRNVPSRFEVLLPVLLVLIDGARRRGQISGAELVNLRTWKRLWAQAQAIRTASVPAATCPFPGAAPYSTQGAAGFMGRETAVRHLAQLVLEAETASRSKRIVALTGASGVGKTSLLQAGLVPALESRQPRSWVTHSVVLGTNPVESLKDLLDHVECVGIAVRKTADIEDAGSPRPHLVIIDQFERVFSENLDHDAREVFLAMMERLTERAVVLISLRVGQIAACTDHSILVDAVGHRGYLLEPMNSNELRAVINSAHRDGIPVAAGVEEVLLAAISGARADRSRLAHEPGELSMLSRTLKILWRERAGSRLTVAGYRRIGGVAGVVDASTDAMWDRLEPNERVIARRILLGLVSVHGDTDDARRRLSYDELRRLAGNASELAVLDKLVDARMMTIDAGEAYLSHELLLTWTRLADWLDNERPTLLVRGKTAADCSEWIATNRDPSLLYRGLRLANAMNYIDDACEVVVEFLRKSSIAEQIKDHAPAY
ncbi:hypothetical protein ACQP1G_17115 [Nocardia sp. CA-107356]|uniref:nSTAND1 domain-containing NTPase n=1 Tax=Nocardia sp. CA-107356 TaxID=3239972 RepID=UPI003D910969